MELGGSARPASPRGSDARAPRASARESTCEPRAPRSDQPPSYVPMLMPVSTISRWPAAEGPAHVGEDHVRGERALVAAGPRDDAVRAVERAAVLDLHEGPRPLHRRPVVADALQRHRGDGLHARQRRQRGVERGCGASSGRSSSRSSASSSARNAALSSLPTRRAPPSSAAYVPGPPGRSSPYDDLRVRVGAAGAADGGPRLLVGRRGHGAGVDEVEVRGAIRVDQRDPGLAQEPGGGLHLGLVDLAAEVDDGGRRGLGGPARRSPAHHSCGLVDMRNAMSPTAVVIP